MFQISRRVDYAVRMMIELSLNAGSFLSAAELSKRTAVSKAFLHKITADLVKAELVTTQAGPGGGIALKNEMSETNLRHILEAVDGPVCLNVCLIRPQECKRDAICPAHDFWGRLQMSIIEQLEDATLDKLVAEAHQMGGNPTRREKIPYLINRDDIDINEFGLGEM